MEQEALVALSLGLGIGVVVVVVIIGMVLERKRIEYVPKEAPFEEWSPERRYAVWRAELARWVEEDGSQSGLDRFLERWRGVPHEKPKPSAPAEQVFLVHGTTSDGQRKFTEFKLADPSGYITIDSEAQMDQLLNGGDPAMLRFIQRNREKVGNALGVPVFKGPLPGDEDSKFKPGQWVRITSGPGLHAFKGELFKVERKGFGSAYYLIGLDSKPVAYEDEMERATPHSGEWWVWNTCAECKDWLSDRPEWTFGPSPIESYLPNDHPTCKRALHGCCVPVNFGRGEAKA